MGGPLLISQIEQYVRQKHPAYSGIETFVETGTWQGDTVIGLSPYFKKLVTIEVDPERYRISLEFGKSKNNIDFVFGDSALLLPEILRGITEPVLFFLDAHSITGGTSTPLLAELRAINEHKNFDVVVVDDVMFFGQMLPALDWTGITKDSVLGCLTDIVDWFVAEDKLFIFLGKS